MNSKWKYVLFDMDGTLVDSAEMVIGRYVEAFQHFDVVVPAASELDTLVGPSAIMSMTKYLGSDLAHEGVKFYRELANRDGYKGLSLFPGIQNLIHNLSNAGLTLAVATSKPENEAKGILAHLGISSYFDFVSGASDQNGIHTKTEVIIRAIEGVSPPTVADVVMIGDRIFDVEGANNIGLPCIFVKWGGAQISEAEGAVFQVETPEELENLLLSHLP